MPINATYKEERALFRNINRYFIFGFAVSFLSIICLSLFSYKVIYNQSTEETSAALRNAIRTESKKLESVTGSYAQWNLSYSHIVDKFDKNWIDENILEDAKRNFDIPYVGLFEDTTEFSTIYSNEEKFGVKDHPAPSHISQAILALKSYVGKNKARVSNVKYGDQIYMIAVSHVQKTSGKLTDKTPFLVTIRPINQEYMTNLSTIYGLPSISLISDTTQRNTTGLPHVELDGDKNSIGYLTWTTQGNAHNILYILIPGALLVLILLCASGFILFRRISKASMGYDDVINDLSQSRSALSQVKEKEGSLHEDKTRFLSTMSHEMKTPMNGLMGMIALLKETELNEAQTTYVNTMENATDSLIKLVDNILDFSKLEGGEVSLSHGDVNIRQIATDVQGLLMPISLQKKLKFDLFFADNVPIIIRSDGLRIRQVLLHLITNSLKFTKVGSVKLNVTAVDLPDNRVELGIQVIDTGIGIPDAIKETLFADFCSADGGTDHSSEGQSSLIKGHTPHNIGESGVGFGLNIVKNIVILLQGKSGIESKLNQGSVFWIQFKADVVKANEKTSKTQDNTKNTIGAKSILVIDETGAGLSYNLLEKSGNTLYSALDTSQAISIIMSQKLDAIIVNIPKDVSTESDFSAPPLRSAMASPNETPIVAIIEDGQDGHDLSQYDRIIHTPITSNKLKTMLIDLDTPLPEGGGEKI